MVVEVKWTTQALDDIENIANFIAKDSEHYAVVQTERFFEKARILETHPSSWSFCAGTKIRKH